MFGFIKKLITGILGFITGLLPGKKKDGGYYLQLDESAAEPTPAQKPAAKPAATSNGTKATAKAPEPELKAAPVAEPAKKPAPAAKASNNGKVAPTEPAKAPAAAVATKKEPIETTFAPKYLAPSASTSNGRRRPGANMSSFLDMANQVKTPNQA
ncbi:hypothetical protein IQ259_24035 [Fortiea sp. LEGE XX443]|uniref:hypothetical protein n=1 Tax=Fortiea sp. LEGE XX443 TaxID=1828611 RepID=UPI0018820C7D|nr:hypothetical protein [Fortiea sp. LEGE XX443]MBE9008046.1 hypothetical protein [Fortiea sp. LEGE XX443]